MKPYVVALLACAALAACNAQSGRDAGQQGRPGGANGTPSSQAKT